LDTEQYKQLFIEEAREHLEILTKSLLILEKEPENIEVINMLFRSAHTLKGSSGMMGFKDFQQLTHAMETAAKFFQASTIGVILTGMGKDGADGMKVIKQYGGITIAQDKSTSIVFSMPKSATELNCIDKVLPLPEIPPEIVHICQKPTTNDKSTETKNITNTQLLQS